MSITKVFIASGDAGGELVHVRLGKHYCAGLLQEGHNMSVRVRNARSEELRTHRR
jgi:hypothetical protein